MAKTLLSLLSLSLLSLAEKLPSIDCSDSAVCTKEYAPVCGSNGVAYSNLCLFLRAKHCEPDSLGLTFTQGDCNGSHEGKGASIVLKHHLTGCENLDVKFLTARNRQYWKEADVRRPLGAFTERQAPIAFKGKHTSHAPHLGWTSGDSDEDGVWLSTTHGVTPDHHLTTLWVEDEDGTPILCRQFSGEDEDTPASLFVPASLATKYTQLRTYTHCNLHGVWEGAPINRHAHLLARNGELGGRRRVEMGESARSPAAKAFSAGNVPREFKAKVEGHTPRISMQRSGRGVVKVTHGSTQEHRITDIWVTDQDGKLVGAQHFKAGENPSLDLQVNLKSVTRLHAYEHCNLHGVWASTWPEVTIRRHEEL